jgi:N-acetylglucosamine-6-phosphate deacetylase
LKYELTPEGGIYVAGQRQILAGSAQSTGHCVAHAARVADLTLSQAWDMASRNPARLLGFDVFRLVRGSRADLVVFDYDRDQQRIEVRATLAAGRIEWGSTDRLLGSA